MYGLMREEEVAIGPRQLHPNVASMTLSIRWAQGRSHPLFIVRGASVYCTQNQALPCTALDSNPHPLPKKTEPITVRRINGQSDGSARAGESDMHREVNRTCCWCRVRDDLTRCFLLLPPHCSSPSHSPQVGTLRTVHLALSTCTRTSAPPGMDEANTVETSTMPAPLASGESINLLSSLMESNGRFSAVEYSSLSDAFEDLNLRQDPVSQVSLGISTQNGSSPSISVVTGLPGSLEGSTPMRESHASFPTVIYDSSEEDSKELDEFGPAGMLVSGTVLDTVASSSTHPNDIHTTYVAELPSSSSSPSLSYEHESEKWRSLYQDNTPDTAADVPDGVAGTSRVSAPSEPLLTPQDRGDLVTRPSAGAAGDSARLRKTTTRTRRVRTRSHIPGPSVDLRSGDDDFTADSFVLVRAATVSREFSCLFSNLNAYTCVRKHCTAVESVPADVLQCSIDQVAQLRRLTDVQHQFDRLCREQTSSSSSSSDFKSTVFIIKSANQPAKGDTSRRHQPPQAPTRHEVRKLSVAPTSHAGKLARLSGRFKVWQTFWCVLVNKSLLFYRDESEVEHWPRKCIDFTELVISGWLHRYRRGQSHRVWCMLMGTFLVYSREPRGIALTGYRDLSLTYLRCPFKEMTASAPTVVHGDASTSFPHPADSSQPRSAYPDYESSDSESDTGIETDEVNSKTLALWAPNRDPVYLVCNTDTEFEQWRYHLTRACWFSSTFAQPYLEKEPEARFLQLWGQLVHPAYVQRRWHTAEPITVPLSRVFSEPLLERSAA
ncbi:unnamed protein product, partial [Dibothriocephalus latus]